MGPTIEVLLRQDCRLESIQIDKESANCLQVRLITGKRGDRRLQKNYKKLWFWAYNWEAGFLRIMAVNLGNKYDIILTDLNGIEVFLCSTTQIV